MRKLICISIAILFTFVMLLFAASHYNSSNDLKNGNSTYAAIPPVKLPPVPPND